MGELWYQTTIEGSEQNRTSGKLGYDSHTSTRIVNVNTINVLANSTISTINFYM